MSAYSDARKILTNNKYTWLITGVAGFIGSNLLEALLALKQNVVGLDNFSTGNCNNLKNVCNRYPGEYKYNFKLITGDICSVADCEQSMLNVDYVLHHAAIASVPLSIEHPDLTHQVNATGFINLLKAAKDANVKRVVYASSSAVYGDSPQFKKQESGVIDPVSPYAVSKYINELYARSFNQYYDMDSIGLRYFNIFGPQQCPNGAYASVIPVWIKALLADEPVYINGDGSNTRDFCYIDNVIQANLLSALTTNPKAINQVYNIGCGREITLKKLLSILQKVTHTDELEIIYRKARKGDIKISSADISNARIQLGFEPSISLEKESITLKIYFIIAFKIFL